ncbi:MAG: ATP-binding cassette domain-containing protein [Rickettsia sp.]|nr:ATP-binding cassette domain-containing protein [Rickettsia sp.]
MIKFKKISLQIGGQVIFENFSGKFLPSDVIFVKGKNGSGKTSLLKIVANLLTPSKGTITLGVNDIPISEALQPYCVYIASKDPIQLDFTVSENIRFWISIYNSENNLTNIVKNFGIEKILEKRCKTLSSGNLKKISLIRFYIAETHLYLLDEVETHLDSDNLNILYKIIQQKSQKGYIGFIATNLKPFLSYNKLIYIKNKKIFIGTDAANI